MYQKKTKELEDVLEKIHPDDIDEYIAKNVGEVLDGDRDFMRYMNEKFKEKGIRKQDVLLRADISLGYGYKLLSEEKMTRQRDVILRICYAAEFTLKETQQALRIYQMNTLYAREPRDAMIMTFFNERPGTILDVNEMLLKKGLQPLRSCGIQN